MPGKNFIALLTLLLLIPINGWANDRKWQDSAEFSLVNTTGNTDILSLAAKNIFIYNFTKRLIGSWQADILYAEDQSVKTAEAYATELRLDYLFTEQLYGFGVFGWARNIFVGTQNLYYVGPGLGYKFLLGPKHFLIGEAGLLYSMEEDTAQIDDSYLSGRVFAEYAYAFRENNRFSQSVEFSYDFSNSNNYSVVTETALTFLLSTHLAFKTSYIISYAHEPANATLENTDTLLAVSLIFSF